VNPEWLQPLAWSAAFWTALCVYRRVARPARPLRFACALVLGAALAHLGWLGLHWPALAPALRERPGLAFAPLAGFCALFVPLGPLLLERSPAAFASLPLALAVARLGCLAAGCCAGLPTRLPWAVAGLHPTALYEIAGLLVLAGAAARAEARLVAPLVLAGFGALRLLIEPLRSAPALGAPFVPPFALAAAWWWVAARLARRDARSSRHTLQRVKLRGRARNPSGIPEALARQAPTVVPCCPPTVGSDARRRMG